MGSYYKHTKTETVHIPYSFRCEQCMKDSGTQNAVITVQAQLNSNFRHLSEGKQQKLAEMAHAKLVKAVKDARAEAAEKQVYAAAFRDECPHCRAPQSWAVSGAKKDLFTVPVILSVFGILLGAGCYFTLENADRLMIAAGCAGICFALAAAVLIFNLIKIGKKKSRTANVLQQNKPVIEWSAVQGLLEER